MQALRLDEVTRRVVAWHNRHPLARRIDASQVHSIGEVSLPFAGASPAPASQPAEAMPWRPPPAAAAPPPPDPEPPPAADPDEGGSEAELEIDIDLHGAAPPAPADDGAAVSVDRAPANLDEPSLDGKPRWRPADPALRPPRPAPAQAVAATPATADGRRRGLFAALRGGAGKPALRAVFSRDFIWPLRPSQVARWVQRHGQPQPLAPADWPRRSIDSDGRRLAQARQQGLTHALQLQVLTAAIGVGDRRIRVLIAADGRVLGPRAYQRSRVGGLAGLLLAAAVGLGWLLPPPGTQDADGPGALAAVVGDAASAAPAAYAAAAGGDGLSVAAGQPAAAASAAPDPAATAAALADDPPAPGASLAAQPAAAASEAAQAGHASLKPDLAAEAQRGAAEQAAAQAQAQAQAAASLLPQQPVYAVVTRPSKMRQTAVNFLPTMRSASALLQAPGPDQREVMQSQGKWFAAWWPFATLADAERARVLLYGRGLKTEVIEF